MKRDVPHIHHNNNNNIIIIIIIIIIALSPYRGNALGEKMLWKSVHSYLRSSIVERFDADWKDLQPGRFAENNLSRYFDPYLLNLTCWNNPRQKNDTTRNTSRIWWSQGAAKPETAEANGSVVRVEFLAGDDGIANIVMFFGGTSVQVFFMLQQPSWIYSHCFWDNRPTDWQAAVFFSASQALAKPWHLLPWAHLANGRRAAATPRWRYVVGSHRRDFRSQFFLFVCFFLKGDFYE